MIASHICVCSSHQLQLVRIHLVRTGHKLAHTWPTSFLLSIEKRKTHDNMWTSFFPHWVFVTPDKNNKTWSHDCYFCETLAPQHVRAPDSVHFKDRMQANNLPATAAVRIVQYRPDTASPWEGIDLENNLRQSSSSVRSGQSTFPSQRRTALMHSPPSHLNSSSPHGTDA